MPQGPETKDQDRGGGRAGGMAPVFLAGVMALTGAAPVLAQAEPASEQRRSVAPRAMQAVAPALAEYTDTVLFGDVWRRPELNPRDRSIVTLSVLIATGKSAQLTGHLGRALDNGVTPVEIAGIVTHLAFYTGWPNAVSALEVIDRVFAERKIDIAMPGQAGLERSALSLDQTPSAMEADIRPVAPKLADLTHGVLFGDLWRRSDLAPRDRSLVTIAALAAIGDREELASHIRRGLENGLTRDQIGETFTHLAFYAGWPRATAAVGLAKAVFAEQPKAETGPSLRVYRPDLTPTQAPPGHFTGSATVTSPFSAAGTEMGGATVTFQPGAHTHWHSHPKGQLLIITDGIGWVQADGEPVRRVKAGDVIWTAPGVRHWHGATRTSAMTHVAVTQSAGGRTVTWFEAVADKDYRGPARDGEGPRAKGKRDD